jgi:hypothetical protein
VVEERGLSLFLHGHQAHHPSHQLLAVAKEEEEQEQHEHEAHHRPKHAGQRGPAHPDQRQEEAAPVLDQPGLDLIGGDRRE